MYYTRNPSPAEELFADLLSAADATDPKLAAWMRKQQQTLTGMIATRLPKVATDDTDPSRGIHPQAVPRTHIDSNKRYTLWQRVGGGWVIERSFGGGHVKGDDSYWEGIATRADSSRPLAFFDEGYNPNGEQGAQVPQQDEKPVTPQHHGPQIDPDLRYGLWQKEGDDWALIGTFDGSEIQRWEEPLTDQEALFPEGFDPSPKPKPAPAPEPKPAPIALVVGEALVVTGLPAHGDSTHRPPTVTGRQPQTVQVVVEELWDIGARVVGPGGASMSLNLDGGTLAKHTSKPGYSWFEYILADVTVQRTSREAVPIPAAALRQGAMPLPEALAFLQDAIEQLAALPPPGRGAWKDDVGFSAATNALGRRWDLLAEDAGGAQNLPMSTNLAGIELLRAHSRTQLDRSSWEAAHAAISQATPMDAEQAKAMLYVKGDKKAGQTDKDGSYEWTGKGVELQTPRRRSFSLKYADIERAGFKPRTEVAWRKDRQTGEFSLWVAPHVIERFAEWISEAYPTLAAAMQTWAPEWIEMVDVRAEPTGVRAEPAVDRGKLDPHKGSIQGVRWEWSEGDRRRLLLLLPTRDLSFAVGDAVTAQNAYRGSYPNTEYWRAFDPRDTEKIAEVVGNKTFRLADAAAALRSLAPVWAATPQVGAADQQKRERKARMLARRFRHSMLAGTNMDTVQTALVEAWPLIERVEPGSTGADLGAWGSWKIVSRRERGKVREKLRISNPWALGGKEWVAQIPGKKGGKEGGTFYWEFPIKKTPMIARALDMHNPPLAMSLRLGILIEQIGGDDRDCDTLEELASAKTVSEIVEPSVRKKVVAINKRIRWPRDADGKQLEPYPYQQVGIAYIVLAGGRALIGDAMGLGKTIQAIGFLLQDLQKTTPAVVVCPNGAKGNWINELAKWGGGQLTPVRIDTSRDRVPMPAPGIVYVIGWGLFPRILERLTTAMRPMTVIYDESHYAKTWGIGRSDAAQTLAAEVPNVLLLSGTPMPNRPTELGHQMHMLDPETFPDKREFDVRFAGGTTVIRQGREIWDDRGATNLGELSDLLRCYMVRRTKTEVGLELPDKTRTLLPAEFGAAERKAYNNVKDNVDKAICAAWRRRSIIRANKMIEDGYSPTDAIEVVNAQPPDAKMLAELAIVQLGYLRRAVAELKVPAAIDWMLAFVQSGRPEFKWVPLVVFAEHRATIKALATALDKEKVPYGLFVGWVSDKAKDQTVIDFMEGRTTIILATQAMREAVTLTRASDMLFVERWWVPSYEEQAEDRIHRISQKNAVNIRYLMAPGTVDDHIGALVDTKRKLIEQVMRGEAVQSVQSDVAARAQEGLALAAMRGIADRLQSGGECRIRVSDL